MKVFVGLGNPGDRYQNTRHNIGFMVADRLCDHFDFDTERQKFEGLLSEGRIAEKKVLIFKPQTFMNLSGQAVGELVRYFNIDSEDVIVFYDELDLPLGKLRLRFGGSAGGHNGVKSCMAHLGEGFCRIRLGIGHPGDKRLVDRHVLGAFSKAEMESVVAPWLDALAENAPLLINNESETFANKLHLAMEEVIKN
jgi:PTH1 family peptidyl-tRNA hydrolase